MQPQIIRPKPKLLGDPRVRQAEQELGALLTGFMGAPVTDSLVAIVEEMLEEFRVTKLLGGVKMPRMRVVALPQAGFIQVWPAEMEHADIQLRLNMLVKSLMKEKRNYDPEELAKAVRRAYPDYSPSMSLKVLSH